VRWQEVALRLALIVGLCVAIMYDVTIWIAASLCLIAIAVTAELAVRPYATSAVDRLLLSCGAVVTTLILVGLGLNLTPWGLTQATWTVAWSILSIGVLAWRRRLRSDLGRPTARITSVGLWASLACLIIVGAGMLALAGVRHWNRQPVLAFSIVSTSADAVLVEIDATSITERYRIVANSRVSGARQYFGAPLTIGSGGDGERVFMHVPINVPGVWIIRLESANNGRTLRWLKVNVHQS
jgi:hypothetical protein